MVDSHFITSQPYPNNYGHTTTPLDNFPLPCTVCEVGFPTEFCESDEVCVKLSDQQISIVATNGSLLEGSPFSLDNQCSPRYLQKLTSDSYAVICQESSYHIFRTTGPGGPQLEEKIQGSGTDGVLVQSEYNAFGQLRDGLHHVEVDIDILVLHDVLTGTFDYIYPDIDCMPHSLGLHTIFSSIGKLIVSCTTYTEERAYFLHSVIYYDSDYEFIDLCDNPIPSPGGNTFAVACNNTLAVYTPTDVELYNSKIFRSRIVYISYLSPTTIVVDTEYQQHIVTVDGSGLYEIVTLYDTTNCTFVHKLITDDIYVTVCENDAQYFAVLVNTTRKSNKGTTGCVLQFPTATDTNPAYYSDHYSRHNTS